MQVQAQYYSLILRCFVVKSVIVRQKDKSYQLHPAVPSFRIVDRKSKVLYSLAPKYPFNIDDDNLKTKIPNRCIT